MKGYVFSSRQKELAEESRSNGNGSPMTWRDHAWYRMEKKVNPMVINAVLQFDGRVDFERLLATLSTRLSGYPRFKQSVRYRRGRPRWITEENFDIVKHVSLTDVGPDGGPDKLQSLLNRLAAEPLDTTCPMWHMTVINGINDGHAIVFRVHHCVTDGLGLVSVLCHLTDDNAWCGVESIPAPQTLSTDAGPRAWRNALGTAVQSGFVWLKVYLQAMRLVTIRSDAGTRLKSPLTGEKQLLFPDPLNLERVRKLSRLMGVTLNDLWLAAVCGALRTYLGRNAEPVSHPLQATMTFNLRDKKLAFRLGNEFGLVVVKLPTDVGCIHAHLRTSSQRMTEIKRSGQPRATMVLLSVLGWFPAFLQEFLLNIYTSRTSLVLTNIEGPVNDRYLAGSRLVDFVCWVPQAGKLGVGLAFVTYAGKIQLSLFADTGLVPEPQRLMELIHHAFSEMELAFMPEQTTGRTAAH